MVVGFFLVGLGRVMSETPGPGVLFLFFGASILALEIKWARELNQQGMQGLERLMAKVKAFFAKRKSGDRNQQ